MSLRIDGSHQITITSTDHPDVKEASLVLDYPTLTGFKMEIEYNELVIGLQIKTFTSWSFEDSIPSVLYKLNQHDVVALQPGMVIQLTKANFIVERFNVGVVSKIGNRTHMEDNYVIAQDLGLDSVLKASFFAVIDGHGGNTCANFLHDKLVADLNQEL
jgi:hypothetical protein